MPIYCDKPRAAGHLRAASTLRRSSGPSLVPLDDNVELLKVCPSQRPVDVVLLYGLDRGNQRRTAPGLLPPHKVLKCRNDRRSQFRLTGPIPNSLFRPGFSPTRTPSGNLATLSPYGQLSIGVHFGPHDGDRPVAYAGRPRDLPITQSRCGPQRLYCCATLPAHAAKRLTMLARRKLPQQ